MEAHKSLSAAGMHVKRPRTLKPTAFGIKRGHVSGSVILIIPSAGNRPAFELAYSLDRGKTWIPAGVTTRLRTTLTGFVAGSTVYFRYRVTTGKGTRDWSDPIRWIVV